MGKYRVAVCDDEKYYMEDVCKRIEEYEEETENEIRIDTYESILKLIDDMQKRKEKYDILFLDVEMAEMNGIDAAKKIREFEETVIICFITNYENYAYGAFTVDAEGYLVKPVKYIELRKLLSRCIMHIQYIREKQIAEQRFVEIKAGREIEVVDEYKILYIEKRRNQCIFHLLEGEVTSYDTLSHVYEKLDHAKFYYVHQGFIANFIHIKEVKAKTIFFGNNIEIPVSRKYAKTMREMHLNKLYRLRAEQQRVKMLNQ